MSDNVLNQIALAPVMPREIGQLVQQKEQINAAIAELGSHMKRLEEEDDADGNNGFSLEFLALTQEQVLKKDKKKKKKEKEED